MNDLLTTSLFSSLEASLREISEVIQESDTVQLVAPADLEGIIALSQLEAAFLDNSISYMRRILPSQKHTPRDQSTIVPSDEGLTIHIDPFHESVENFTIESGLIHICPTLVEVSFATSTKNHHGAVDCVAICAVIAAIMSPQGARVRRQRAMALAGTWLRQSMDANYDPIMSMLRDHLSEEGSIEVRTIVEVKQTAPGMIPDMSERMLQRLKKGWDKMDVDARSSAISELVLPSLKNERLSTMRLEELIWHRSIVPGHDYDIASQLHLAAEKWPEELDAARLHSSVVADTLISKGHL